VAGRFPVYTDADIRGPLVEGLKRAGWDVLRAMDVYPERTKDPIHFEEAARRNRVLVSHDVDQLKIGHTWIERGRPFKGLLTWPQVRYREWSESQILAAFEALAAEENPFPAAYPIRYLKARR
jgi:predicted nuclease of predicted toxin-antitoxin system